MSAMTTWQPSSTKRRAIAPPMTPAAPVINATFPCSLAILSTIPVSMLDPGVT